MMEIRSFNAHRSHHIRHAEVRRLVRLVLTHERIRKAAVNVVFVDDARMTDLNGTYLKHWYATDVLSFSLGEARKGFLEGEVYVNLDQARRQSSEYRETFADEKRRLVIHGVLHLAGYSDATAALRSAMAAREDRYIGKLAARRSKRVHRRRRIV